MTSWKQLALLCLTLVFVGRPGSAQAVPAAASAPEPGFHLPTAQGSLTYSATASESLDFGFNGANETTTGTSFSGNLGFISNSSRDPFSAVGTAGYAISTSGGGQSSQPFLSVALSQVLTQREFNVVVADSLSYLPETPTVGLSGLPGQGDLGVAPISIGTDTGQGLLTQFGARVSNSVSGTVSRPLGPSFNVSGTGSYQTLHFLGSNTNAYSSNSLTGSGTLLRRLGALSNVGGTYAYSTSSFPSDGYTFASQSILADYSRQLSRRASLSFSAGPEFVSGTGYQGTTSFSATGSFTYLSRLTTSRISFVRSNNSGSGVVNGAETTSLQFSVSRPVTRFLTGSVNAAYSRTSQLAQPGVPTAKFNTYIFSGQLGRPLGENLSVYGSYSLERQGANNNSGLVAPVVFNGTSQFLGFGITYSPRQQIRFGHS